MNQQIAHYGGGPTADLEIFCLSDISSTFPVPAPAILSTVPSAVWPAIRAHYPAGFVDTDRLVVQVTCYLIRHGDRTILIDSGMGQRITAPTGQLGHGELLNKLHAIGVAPTEVDTVFHTHLHQDHIGWNMHEGSAGWQPTFPNARYLGPQLDWAMIEAQLAAQGDGAEQIQQQLLPLQERGLLTLLEGEIELTDQIRAFPTPGHSPGHMSVQINTQGSEKYLIAGDAFFHPLQFAMPTAHTAIDARYDAAQANDTRTHLVQRIVQDNLLVSACHFYVPAFGRVSDEGGGLVWQPVAG